MARIAVFNQKGGVGKTTTSLNLSAALARRGQRPLSIDLDPQAHLSHISGTPAGSADESILSFFDRARPLADLIRSGSGVYVNSPPERSTRATAALGESPTELMQARAALEGTVVALACARVTPAALAQLRACVDGMRQEIGRRRTPLEFDRQFHLTIAEMSGNSVMQRLVVELFDDRHSPISTKLRSRYENMRTWNAALKEHEAILHAIEARDPLAAQAAMRSHLKASEHRWVGG